MRSPIIVLVALCSVPAALAAASVERSLRPPLRVDRDDRPIAKPAEHLVSEMYAIVNNSWIRHLGPSAVAGGPALDINAWDEVPDSSWFTNRIGKRPMTADEILAGPGAAMPGAGPWTIARVLDEGYTPKLQVTDAAGRSYVLKFDPAVLERNSAAERISTLVLHAAGYNVPNNVIVRFRPDVLRLTETSYLRDALGNRRPMTAETLHGILARLARLPDGRLRGLASFFIAGAGVGKFVYTGTRKDDPNDLIPHERRRELRGLRVIASWINHADTGDKNTYDAFEFDNGRDGPGHIRHYLLDFGSALGAGDYAYGPFRIGHEFMYDGAAIGRSFVTLGTWRRPWEVTGRIVHPEVGYFQADIFEPAAWKPSYPNLAFERMDDADAYWGAKIVTAFSDDAVSALARAGEYTRPEVTQYVDDILIRRRDAIGRYWFDRVTPLEAFDLTDDPRAGVMRVRDLAVERGYASEPDRRYQLWAEDLKGRRLTAPVVVSVKDGKVPLPDLRFPSASTQPADRFGRTPVVRVLVESNRRDGGWARPVEVFFGYTRGYPDIEILGWNHGARSGV